MTVPSGQPTAEELRSLADEIARTGRLEITRSHRTASDWHAWASDMHRLASEMPALGARPSYMADDGIDTAVRFYIGTDDAQRINEALQVVLRTADAITGAWLRAATDLAERVHDALREVDADPEHFASLRPSSRDGGK